MFLFESWEIQSVLGSYSFSLSHHQSWVIDCCYSTLSSRINIICESLCLYGEATPGIRIISCKAEDLKAWGHWLSSPLNIRWYDSVQVFHLFALVMYLLLMWHHGLRDNEHHMYYVYSCQCKLFQISVAGKNTLPVAEDLTKLSWAVIHHGFFHPISLDLFEGHILQLTMRFLS